MNQVLHANFDHRGRGCWRQVAQELGPVCRVDFCFQHSVLFDCKGQLCALFTLEDLHAERVQVDGLPAESLVEEEAILIVDFKVFFFFTVRLLQSQLVIKFRQTHELLLVVICMRLRIVIKAFELLLAERDGFNNEGLQFQFLAGLSKFKVLFENGDVFKVPTAHVLLVRHLHP